jgi:hypothetical protein
MNTFTAAIEPFDRALIAETPGFYRQLIEEIKPGKMLTLTFPEGTSRNEVHKVRVGLNIASMRLQGCGKVKTHVRGNKLHAWLESDEVGATPKIGRIE